MASKTIRPYVKSSIKLNLNIDYNSKYNYKQILEELNIFLENAGFVKKTKKYIGEQKVKDDVESKICKKNNLVLIGLKSIFRELQNKLPKATEGDSIFGSIILFDVTLFNTTALTQIFSIFALKYVFYEKTFFNYFSSISIKFFVVPQLSINLSAKLNFGKCSSLLIYDVKESENIRQLIFKNLKSIERAKNIEEEKTSFKTPKLVTPIGKTGKEKKKKGKKKRGNK